MMTNFLKIIAILAWGIGSAHANPSKPNILFIFADDLGWGDLGCYGHQHIKTPHLDKMARQGKQYVNFYANASVCSPSRVAYITGQYPQRHRVYAHFANTTEQNEKRKMPDCLDPSLPVLPRLLKQAGYATGHFGKWHLSGYLMDHVAAATEYGYDESRCAGVKTGPNFEEHWKTLKKGEARNTHSAKWEVDATIDFISRHREQPFFVNLWFQVPHTTLWPNEAQKKAYKKFRAFGPYADGYRDQRGITNASTPHEVYYATVTEMDRQIGRLFAQLEKWGELDNTLIVFSSDNGPESIDITLARHSGVGSPGIFRGEKRSLYEGGIRVPGIVRWPAGGVPSGVMDRDSIASVMDLYPTFLEVADVEIPQNIDGVSLLKSFRDDAFERPPLHWEFNVPVANKNLLHRNPRLAMREGDWKLLMNPDGSKLQLYNLKLDPTETDSVASERPEIVAKMERQSKKWFQTLPNAKFRTTEPRTKYEEILGVK